MDGLVLSDSILENTNAPTKYSRGSVRRNCQKILTRQDEKLIMEILEDEQTEMEQLAHDR